MVPNPSFFEDLEPYKMTSIVSIIVFWLQSSFGPDCKPCDFWVAFWLSDFKELVVIIITEMRIWGAGSQSPGEEQVFESQWEIMHK